ncbi:unnamed protein product, partial [Rotaria sp. Silwood2]
MPLGKEFSKDEKTIFYRVIAFVDSEKDGPKIPMYNTNDRLQVMLGLSRHSISNLRQEMLQLIEKQNNSEYQEKDEEEEPHARPRRRTTSDTQIKHTSSQQFGRKKKRMWSASSITTVTNIACLPLPMTPQKTNNCGRKKIILTEFEEDSIRYQFHLLLASKQYPTTAKLLMCLLEEAPDFPIRSERTLLRHMRRLGFKYAVTSKAPIRLDATSFVASRAKYFRSLTDLRNNDVIYYYHDETWSNSGEERRQVWLDENGDGRLRNTDGKGKPDFYLLITKIKKKLFFEGSRLAISALISPNGFHLSTVDVFKCDSDHNMCSDHFVQWIERTCFILRQEHGNTRRICLILDNATWHNAQTEESKLPKRAWRKDKVEEWLQ